MKNIIINNRFVFLLIFISEVCLQNEFKCHHRKAKQMIVQDWIGAQMSSRRQKFDTDYSKCTRRFIFPVYVCF